MRTDGSTPQGRTRRIVGIAVAAAAVTIAVLVPETWFASDPRMTVHLDPPFRPISLFRSLLMLDALLALGWSAGWPLWPSRRPAGGPAAVVAGVPAEPGVRRPLLWLGLIFLGAAALRLHGLDAQLWLDEAAVLVGLGDRSVLDTLFATPTLNNHLLYTLSMLVSTGLFGAEAWAARLPAALAGIATVPAVYALARLALSERDSLLAASLVAVSYHHVFFSQNARGYSLLLLWSVVATTMFLRALEHDTDREWALYGLASLLGCATMLFGVFVPAGHALVWAVLWARRRWSGERGLAFGGRPLVVWGFVGLAVLHLYAGALPWVLSIAADQASGAAPAYRISQWERLGQLWRGLLAGLGGIAIAALGVVLVPTVAALPAFVRRQPVFTLALTAPLLLEAVVVVRLAWSPRFFLVALPVAAVLGIGAASTWRRGRFLPVLVVAVFTLVSFLSLPRYYRIPKQASRDGLAWIAARARPGDVVVAVDTARWGAAFYAPRVAPALEMTAVRSRSGLETVEDRHRDGTVWLLTSFEPALRVELPDLYGWIVRDYRPVRRFPATVEDGEITIWTSAPGAIDR
ncbi:MAG: glycosyltransferase family 39 protein [Gemmatimonadota bacterium]